MGDDNEHVLLLQKKVKFYYDNQTRVHVTFKREKDGSKWRRGYIKEISSDFFILWEDYLKQDIPVFFIQIDEVEKFIPPKEKELVAQEIKK